MLEIPVFKVDVWDGGERHNFGFYLKRDLEDMEQYSHYASVRKNDIVSPVILVVYDDLKDLEKNSIAALQRRVWDKLTPLEREVMGLKQRP